MKFDNFIFVLGCKPKSQVSLSTTMVQDIIDVIKCRINTHDNTITFPDVFENLKGTDASFEIITSSNLQPLVLDLISDSRSTSKLGRVSGPNDGKHARANRLMQKPNP